MRFRDLLLVFVLLMLFGCAVPRVANNPRSFKLQDEVGQGVDVCIVSVYHRMDVFSWFLADPLKGKVDDDYYLMWPSEMKSGDAYMKVQVKDPIFIPPFFIGEDYHPTAYVLLRHGFLPMKLEMYNDLYGQDVRIMRRGNFDSEFELLLSGRLSKARLASLIGSKGGKGIVDKYTEADRTFLRKCYYGDGENK